MYYTDRGIEELENRRGEEEVSFAWLAEQLRALAAGDLTVVVERSGDVDLSSFRALTLEIVGADRPGIVRDISHALAHHRVNIEELVTEVTSAAMSGELLFRAQARIRLPETKTVREIRDESEFGRLDPNDVLVCPITSPAWSVLFTQAGALVTDNRGLLSHAAVIAREPPIVMVVTFFVLAAGLLWELRYRRRRRTASEPAPPARTAAA